MRWCYFKNYAISKAHYFFKLGREKNIFVKVGKKWTNTAVPEDHEDLCWKSEDCVGVVFSRDLVWVCAYSCFWWSPWRPFYIFILLIKERIKKNTFALQGLQGYTRIHNIKPNHDWKFDDLVFRGLQEVLKSFPDMKKSQKPKT